MPSHAQALPAEPQQSVLNVSPRKCKQGGVAGENVSERFITDCAVAGSGWAGFFEKGIDRRLAIVAERDIVAQMDNIGPEPHEIVHVADAHLPAGLADLEDERDQCAECGARKRANVFEVEDKVFGKIGADERTKLLAQFSRVGGIGDGVGEELDDHDPRVSLIVEVKSDVRLAGGRFIMCMGDHAGGSQSSF